MKKFKVTFQLIDDGELVTSSCIVSVKESDLEENETFENHVALKVKDGIETDGFRGVSIINVKSL